MDLWDYNRSSNSHGMSPEERSKKVGLKKCSR